MRIAGAVVLLLGVVALSRWAGKKAERWVFQDVNFVPSGTWPYLN